MNLYSLFFISRHFSTSSSHYFSILRTSISASDLSLLKRTHNNIITSGLSSDRFLSNNLITAYAKCDALVYARKLFDKIPDRDLVTWNSILAAYAQSPNSGIANVVAGLQIFRDLRCSVVSTSKLTLAPVLKLCLLSGCVWACEAVHCYAVKIGLDWDVFVSGGLVNIYSKFGLVKEARCLFDGMLERDVVLWNVMLKAYVDSGFEGDALCFFSEYHRSGLCPDSGCVRDVLSMISDTGSGMERWYAAQIQGYATKVFPCNDDDSNVIVWNKKLSECLQDGQYQEVVDCFLRMVRSGMKCDGVTFVVILAAATGTGDRDLGQQIHSLILKSGSDGGIAVANSLINMYSKMGLVPFAQKVFSGMEELDLISWNSMITSCSQNKLERESIRLFAHLLQHGLRPDHFTLASVLRACSSISTDRVHLAKQIHVHTIKTRTVCDSYVLTALIDVYSTVGYMAEAELLFKNKSQFDVATCNAMMFGYIESNQSHQALEIYAMMHKLGSSSDKITLATAAKGCGSLVSLEQGKQIHAHAIKTGGDSDLQVSSSILDMYVKCGEMLHANLVFDGIPEPDDVAWTTMISGSVENGNEDGALSIYQQMRLSGVLPDEYTFATLIKATSSLTALEQGKQLHGNVVKLNCATDTFIGTALIDMYAKCGNIEEAYTLFKRMHVRNIALWNAMLVGLAQHGHGKEALDLFEFMKCQGPQPDGVTFIGVLSACSHSGLVSEAYDYFQSMQRDYDIKPQIEHYACLVDALGRAGRIVEANKLVQSMPFEPSASMYRALLGACRVEGNVDIGKQIAERLLALDPYDPSAHVLLSNIYAAANQWNNVTDARRTMKRTNVKKDPGFSWIDIKNKVHMFVVDDRSHPEADFIYNKVDNLMKRIKEEGYVPDTEFVLLDLEEEEKERALYYHSEKLAIAYALMHTSPHSIIRVIKNLRVCGDCHNAIKYMSKVVEREIVLRDANRFHRFVDGTCSCRDYW